MAYSEFYVQTTGSNLNAGSTTSDSAVYTSTNGGWNSGTGVFTPTSGNPSLTVSVGDFASVYLDAATVTGFVGRVTNVTSTTITVSITAKSGTIPTTAGTGLTCKVGGAWAGPNAAVAFPFNFITAAQTNAAGDFPRVNFKSGTNYAITAAMTHANTGPIRFQGYTTTPGDLGKATIDGGTSGASYGLLTVSGTNCDFLDLIFQNNGSTGNSNGVTISSGIENYFCRCIFSNFRATGLVATANWSTICECEAFLCNASNSSNAGGFTAAGGGTLIRCVSHDNAGSNSVGFYLAAGVNNQCNLIDCIADTNGAIGFHLVGGNSGSMVMMNCDAYNNVSDGLRLGNPNAAPFYIENCNFVKNGGYGINGFSAFARNGAIVNCGFGTGTQANTSGTTTGLSAMNESGSVSYAADVTPWVDPANGNFRVNLAAAKGTGRGAFTQTQAGYAGTTAYPDIGAAQSQGGGGVAIIGTHGPIIRGLVA